MTYDAEVFDYFAKADGRDAKAVKNYCDGTRNSYTDEYNASEGKWAGYFKETLWTAEEFLANSNFEGECIVDSDKFHAATIYLAIEDPDSFGCDGTQIGIAGNLCFGDTIIGTQDIIVNFCPPGSHWAGWGECVIGTRTCSRCGAVYNVYAESHDHIWDEGVVTVEPSSTTVGEKVFTCLNNPEHTRTEEIPFVDYIYIKNPNVAAGMGNGVILVVPGTTVAELLAATNGTAVWDRDGNTMSAETVLGTDMQLVLLDGTTVVDSKTIAVLGDLNGDGWILANDARTALRASVGLDTLNDAQSIAADVNCDGLVMAYDARSILRGSVGLEDPADWFAAF